MSDTRIISNTPAAGSLAPGASAPPLPPPRVPDHELIRRIGRGAYGEVWLARCATGAYRAVKIVHRQSFDHDRPFEREFEGILKFEPVSRTHDSQVDILHVGRSDDCFYYVMELADDQATGGQINPDQYTPRTLKSDLQFQGRLQFEECVRIGIALATALEHLHENGLVHRDVKPSNIIFVNGVPKLADIGLVTGVDATRSFVGTEGFAAPEGAGTPEADLYSLGKVLYEAATGKDRQEFPELPTQLRELPDREGLMELNAVIARACRHDPKDRYHSAAAMRADLALLQSGKSLARLHRTEKQLRFVQRAGAVVTAIAALIAAGWLWQARQTHLVHNLANANARLAEENRERIVRSDIAGGVKLLDEGDPAGALLWFADALPLVTNKPAEEAIHRIRIQQTLNQIPRVVQVLPHENEVLASAFSDDGRRIVTGTDWGQLRVWDARTGAPLWQPLALAVDGVRQVRFTRDGQRVFASSLRGFGFAEGQSNPTNIAAIIEAETGRHVFSLAATNLLRADLSPDDRWLVTADTGNSIQVHDARDGRLMAEFKGHTNRILQFQFSTNGNLLATSSEDHTVRLWRLPSGEPAGSSLRFEPGPIALSQDGSLLAMARTAIDRGTNSTVQTWDVPSGTSVGPPIEIQGAVGALWFVSRAEHTLFVMTDKVCALFDSGSHKQLLTPVNRPSGSPHFSVSPDGRRITFGGSEGLEGVWSLETGERLLPPCLRDRPLTDVNFSPDGSQLLATSINGTATLLSSYLLPEDASYRFDAALAKGQPKALLEWHRFSPDRRHFLLILMDGTVRRVDFEQMSDVRIPATQSNGLRAIQATFDTSGHRGAIFYSGAGTNLVEIWSEDGHNTNRFVLLHPTDLSDKLLFTPDGSRLLTPGRDGQIRFWRTSDGTLERSVQVQAVGQSVLFPDGNTAFAVSAETRLFTLFDRATGLTVPTHLPPMNITAFCFNSKGDRFASAGEVNWSRVWNARTCEPLTSPLEHGGEVRWVDWSPDNKRLLTAGLTPEVKVWDAATGQQLLAPLRLGSKPIETAQWSLDSRFIVARSDEDTVRVWDAATGEPVTPVLKHSSYVRLAHLVGSNRLVTLSLPNLMRAWDLKECPLPLEVIADYAKLLSGRRLNAAGALLALKSAELGELATPLRSSHPELFSISKDELREWHRRQVPEPTNFGRINAGLFHLDRLAELEPGDPWVKEQQARFQACQIPARDPRTPANLVDLSEFYTHSFGFLPSQELANLPRGVQRLGGTMFDVRGMVCLDMARVGDPDRFAAVAVPMTEVRGIKVGRRCRELNFLESIAGSRSKQGEEVARWIIHFADGSAREWPMVYGEHALNWWWKPGRSAEPSRAIIAWKGQLARPVVDGPESIHLFKALWTNPLPEVEVSHLDFVLGMKDVRPFVVAITAE